MNGRFILDTNIIIALFAKDPAIHDCIAKAAEVFVPSIAVVSTPYEDHHHKPCSS